jgi:hypothetical protein
MSEDIQYQSVTVDVPADRVAEFHHMFGRFLAGDMRRGRGGRGGHHRGPHGHRHGHGCAGRRPDTEAAHGETAEA